MAGIRLTVPRSPLFPTVPREQSRVMFPVPRSYREREREQSPGSWNKGLELELGLGAVGRVEGRRAAGGARGDALDAALDAAAGLGVNGAVTVNEVLVEEQSVHQGTFLEPSGTRGSRRPRGHRLGVNLSGRGSGRARGGRCESRVRARGERGRRLSGSPSRSLARSFLRNG